MLRTGWTEDELAAASPAVLQGMRRALWTEILAPVATFREEHLRDELDDAAFDLGKPSDSARRARASRRISEGRARLATSVKHRDEIRTLLWPPDEADGDD